jgi:long-subunit acyl-CoA synthetase (AMP-forming)
LVLWVDQTNSAEILVAQMGAIKAGVQIVTFDEKENIDSLNHALKDSGARGFLFSPQTVVSQEKQTHTTVSRQTFL